MDTWLIWSLALFAVGLLITVIEVMVPSGGLLGIAALVCLIGSLACAYQVSGLFTAILAGIEVICVPSVVVLTFKILPKTSFGRDLILTPPSKPGSPQAAQAATKPKQPGQFDHLVGAEGVVVTMCRPSGTAEFAGRRVSVITHGEVIAERSRVRVVEVEGNRVVIEAVKN